MSIEAILYPGRRRLKNGGNDDNVIPIPPNPGAPNWWERKVKPKAKGILASVDNYDLRKLYGGYLVPFGYTEEQILKMPMDELEGLFNEVMAI